MYAMSLYISYGKVAWIKQINELKMNYRWWLMAGDFITIVIFHGSVKNNWCDKNIQNIKAIQKMTQKYMDTENFFKQMWNISENFWLNMIDVMIVSVYCKYICLRRLLLFRSSFLLLLSCACSCSLSFDVVLPSDYESKCLLLEIFVQFK